MKKAVVVLLAALTLGWIGVCAAAPLKSEEEPAWEAEKMVRLHVVAQSDLACDQDEKLLVRDAVLQILEAPLCNVKSREEAAAVIETMLPQIVEAARGALAKETERDAPQVTTALSTERFPSIAYRGRIVPAGEYMALRITIGRGGGRNWWCVLVSAAVLRRRARRYGRRGERAARSAMAFEGLDRTIGRCGDLNQEKSERYFAG